MKKTAIRILPFICIPLIIFIIIMCEDIGLNRWGDFPEPTPPTEVSVTPTPTEMVDPSDEFVASLEFVDIEQGWFIMGSPSDCSNDCDIDETPQHYVVMSGFQIMKNEVTIAQYYEYLSTFDWISNSEIEEAYEASEDNHDLPATNVTFDEAQTFCNWVDGDLPTEAQWEFAARGTSSKVFPWGGTYSDGTWDSWDCSYLNTGENCSPDTYNSLSPVGTFTSGANDYGLNDMAGNVWEWTRDYYIFDIYYQTLEGASNPDNDGVQDDNGNGVIESWEESETISSYMSIRGASYLEEKETFFRIANRSYADPDSSYPNLGFRCIIESN